MRKLTIIGALLVALVAAGYAVADGMEGATTATAVAGTFAATGASTSSRTCTTGDGKTIVVTDGRYTGMSAGSADLTGAITLRARSVINTTDDVGVVSGTLKIDTGSGHGTGAAYSAVYEHGSLAGLASGRGRGHSARLLANLSATFSAASGFTAGKLGEGSTGGAAVELGGSSCRASRGGAEKSEAHGTISALSNDSITVAGLTCAVSPGDSADVNAKFKTGDVAEIRCALHGSANTLTSIRGKKH